MEGMLFLRSWMAEDILPSQETVCSTELMCKICIIIYLFICRWWITKLSNQWNINLKLAFWNPTPCSIVNSY